MGTVEQDLNRYLVEQDRLQAGDDRFERMQDDIRYAFNSGDDDLHAAFLDYLEDVANINETVATSTIELFDIWLEKEAEKRIEAEDKAYEPDTPYEDL